MPRKLFVLLLATFPLFSCNKEGRPADVLPPAKMEKIFLDLHVADGYSNSENGVYKDRDYLLQQMYQGVLNKHEVNRQTFFSSYLYYLDHPIELDSIYEKVYDGLDSLMKVVE